MVTRSSLVATTEIVVTRLIQTCHFIVEHWAGVILREHALQRGILFLDRDHRLVNQLADRRLLGIRLQLDQRACFGTQKTFSALYSSRSSATE